MEKSGMPHALIDTLISYDEAQQNGEAATVSDSIKTILGRPARTLKAFVHDYANSFR